MTKKQRLGVTVALLLAFGAFIASCLGGASGDIDISVSGNPAIDALLPARGDEVLQQQPVGIDFAPGFTGSNLVIAGVVIPPDQLKFAEALGQLTFEPGEGKVLVRLPPETVCATMNYWPLANPSDVQVFDWCFTVS